MAVYTVYTNNLAQRYRAHICSFATVFFVSIWAIAIISPFFIAYQSLGFWLKESTYREQPYINYKHKFLLILQGPTLNTLLGYGTHEKFKTLLGEDLRIPIVKSYESDDNNDGLKESLTFDLELPLQIPESIHSVQLLLFFDYRLYKYTSLHMESLAYLHYDSSLPGEEFFNEGYLKFQQKIPLPHRGSFTKYNISIIEESAASNANIYTLEKIFNTYQARNVTTNFIGRYPVWRSGRSSSFKIHTKIDYPEETITYRPGFWQLIKFAWIQYLAIFFIFVYFLGFVKQFVYENQLVTTIPSKLHTD